MTYIYVNECLDSAEGSRREGEVLYTNTACFASLARNKAARSKPNGTFSMIVNWRESTSGRPVKDGDFCKASPAVRAALTTYANYLSNLFAMRITTKIVPKASLDRSMLDRGYPFVIEVDWNKSTSEKKLFVALNWMRFASSEFTGNLGKIEFIELCSSDPSPAEFVAGVMKGKYTHYGHMPFTSSPFDNAVFSEARNRSLPGELFGYALCAFAEQYYPRMDWGDLAFVRDGYSAFWSGISGDTFKSFYAEWILANKELAKKCDVVVD